MITEFKLIDYGLEEICRIGFKIYARPFEHWCGGWGTDAESALDAMLDMMESLDYNITGLETRIKNTWRPSTAEGDGLNMYHLVLKFNVSQESLGSRLGN